MTRTDVMASSRPWTEGATRMGSGSARLLRRLAVIPAALLALALFGPGTVLAAEGTSGYSQEPGKPTTTTTTTTTPTTTPTTTTSPTGTTSPSKETSEPTKAEASSPTPTSSSSPEESKAKASTLPFTGLDLRWSVGIGILLMGAGLSIVGFQRRQRHAGRR
jgi:hypothetical protein